MTAILDYIQSRINEAQMINYPFPHLLIDDFFPDYLYCQMLDNSSFIQGNDNAINHLSRDVAAPDVWLMARDEIYPGVLKMLEKKFEKQIQEKIDNLTKYNYFLSPPNLDDGDPNLQLLQRTESFSIPPHVHAPSEYLSILHYLPETNEHANAGTQMYPLKKSYEKNISWNEYPEINGEYLGEHIIAPYMPNTAVIWVSDFKAIHGRTVTGIQRRYIYAYKLFNPDCVNWGLGFLKVRVEP